MPCLFPASGLVDSTMCYEDFCSILPSGPTVEKECLRTSNSDMYWVRFEYAFLVLVVITSENLNCLVWLLLLFKVLASIF